ncbi:MAG: magnesium and cobalt transport protein CorA [Zetaproteobacteria bacterium CG12_big_fil_rev_8_21_14_0_65_54_13]|nr:MAG: magnesium and cobalt transport protein CorA [Zetaproteobacteria bacterium CG12_big_fil_rev_8_21_14_0_65_54_13]PIX53403.1 MAG: magnesium and cobalt transport protein CorA [Zetaproteobacteria bacterium CG_4_10_14_3_um_filter_54_28]PJA31000.1 MAG: magnesium and cobalt transport protein CorA [Zetaproteobacteria bacterium CG_4_9_14_3_um_filter_54_145]
MKKARMKAARQPYFGKRYHTPGTAPGTLAEPLAPQAAPARIRLLDYSPDTFLLNEDAAVADCLTYIGQETVTWLHLQGHPEPELLRTLGEAFDLHPLAMEDVLNTGQRPKIEPFDQQLFLIMSLPIFEQEQVITRQISLFANARYIISFCEGPDDPFMPLIKRMQTKSSSIRKRGADYLLYAILDLVIDQGFPVLESFGLQLEELEDNITESGGGRALLDRIHMLKRELILLRRMVWPQREVITQLLREGSDFIAEDTRIFLRDCYDHTVQIMDLLETYRDMAGSILDIYLSSVSNRLNETMRVLAVISTIFIPMTFVAGVYGMNFDRSQPLSMPELGWSYGYPLFWLLMACIACGMIFFFKRKGWF